MLIIIHRTSGADGLCLILKPVSHGFRIEYDEVWRIKQDVHQIAAATQQVVQSSVIKSIVLVLPPSN